jgi:hypothetical protein
MSARHWRKRHMSAIADEEAGGRLYQEETTARSTS